jgi:hypothetical protein
LMHPLHFHHARHRKSKPNWRQAFNEHSSK